MNKLRLIGVCFIPLIYAFVYIIAFFNPFASVGQIDARIITLDNDPLGKAFVQSMMNASNPPIEIGETKYDIAYNKYAKNPSEIYINSQDMTYEKWNQKLNNLVQKPFLTIVVNPFNNQTIDKNVAPNQTLTQILGDSYIQLYKKLNGQSLDINQQFQFFFNNSILSNSTPLLIYLNYSKNYVLGTTLEATSLFTKIMQHSVVEMLSQTNSVNTYIEAQYSADPDLGKKISNDFSDFIKALKSNPLLGSSQSGVASFINTDGNKDQPSLYGFGLAPFFISIGMWVGSLSATLAIHGRVYNRYISKIRIYLAKFLLLIAIIFVQTTVLFFALSLTGFTSLSWSNFLLYWFTAFLVGVCFCAIVQAIRYSIPNRVCGILIVLAFLIFMISASGGVYPISSENIFFQHLHNWIPFTYSVHSFREASFDTDWVSWIKNIGLLSSFSIAFFSFGISFYFYRKNRNERKEQNIFLSGN